MDKLFQNRNDETVYGRVRRVIETQNPSNPHETMEETENHLQKFKLSKLEVQDWM